MITSTKRVRSSQGSIFTEAAGEGDKGTILLVMGATASMVWWPDSLIEALVAGGYRTIRFDHRDTGASSVLAPGEVNYDLAELRDDLFAILDAYDVEAAHVVGLSLGGYVAQILALTHPARVKTLTLIASEPLGVPYEGEGLPPGFMEHFGAMASLDWADADAVTGFMMGIARLSAGRRHDFDDVAVERRIRTEIARTENIQSAFNHSMIAGSLPTGASAAEITQPVLLIHGGADPIISANAARTSKAIIPSSELLILPDLGHELVDADMALFASAIITHCGKGA
ncbi:alpha/beta hydrolase [Devosia sp. SD17-2]|jgi:pimeloyl-ACP methyl ester carboxylesterase|uniref:alpha/beta fold hydrolase n=1 Tax=Devosia sp. SD17-2 TaxID=2976459 RepID=UPI0023D80551|nr:alpha/beta hydrolase [Devosia sp. SD17-2]WEJ33951.1 alpha/beta fold hydrolase [Devosia sp. SD17-2]